MGGRVARVLLDTPLPQLDHLFDYSVPESLARTIEVGSLVSVPLRGGKRQCNAYVIEIGDSSEFIGQLQPVEKVISSLPVLSTETFQLARRIADRQAGSAIDVLRLAIPPRYVRAEKAFLSSAEVPPETTSDSLALIPRPDEYADWHLEDRTFVVTAQPTITVTDKHTMPAWVSLLASLATEQLSLSRSSIVVVPDFRDLDVLESFLAEFGYSASVIRVDSEASGQQRYLNYLRSKTAEPLIILGNRSAALSPAHNLGLIAMWDDADENYVEPLAPYAHSRDIALLRQQQSGSALVFASNAISTDIARLVAVGFAELIQPSITAVPAVIIADSDAEDDSKSARIPPAAWLGAKSALSRGPVLFQVSTPGYAPAIACVACNEIARCTHCAGPLKLTNRGGAASCRWCGQLAASWSCKSCRGTTFKPIASGSERTAEEIGRAFPGVPVIVADGSHVITRLDSKPALVIATPGAEPIADGGYAAVVLLDGERLRSRESLRVNESVIRLWSNAASLAATGSPVFLTGAGEYLGNIMRTWSQHDFALQELRDRQALRLPPAVRIATISGHQDVVAAALRAIEKTASLRIIGPVGIGDGATRALITCDYKVAESVALTLRSEIVRSATNARRVATRENPSLRILRLKVRFDDPSIDNLGAA